MKNRRDFLRLSGLAGAAALLPWTKMFANSSSNVCTLIPYETEGPYPYPGGELSNPLNIVDVRGGQPGVQLDYIFHVVDEATCNPLQNVRVDIWHCNINGEYSGYNNQVGQTWLRGFQMTDVNGIAQFTSIYPGWYNGRATHLHFEVFYNNVMVLTSQLAYDKSVSDTVHASPLYASRGVNPTLNSQDGIFNNSSADLALETVVPTGSVSAGYTVDYTIGLSGITGVNNPVSALENITIYPDPVADKLTIFHPRVNSSTSAQVLTMDGRLVAVGSLMMGDTVTTLDAKSLAKGLYILVVESQGKKHAIKFVKI